MDPLTHTLVGAGLAVSGLRRSTPLATATLLIGANLPDVDALSYFVSSDVALGFRRGWTHGILAMAVLPVALAAAMVLYDRLWRRPRGAVPARPYRLVLLSFLAVATHPFLDWLNTYGIRLLMPFDGRWFYGDTLFIVDPWLWLVLGSVPFLAGTFGPRGWIAWGALGGLATLVVMAGAPSTPAKVLWVAGLVALIALRRGPFAAPSEHAAERHRAERHRAERHRAERHRAERHRAERHRAERHRAERLARAALVAAGLYVALLYAGSAVAEREIRSTLAEGDVGPVEEVMVGPLPARVLTRDVLVVTPESYRFGTFDWLARPRLRLDDRHLPRLGQPNATTEGAPEPELFEAAMTAPCLRGMAIWMRYPAVEIEERGDGWDVYLLDARYSRGRREGFATRHVGLGHDLEPSCD